MKILAALILSPLLFSQAAPTQPDPLNGNTPPSHDDPSWTLAFPTPKEIIPPKTVPGPNCEKRTYPKQALHLSKASATIVEFHVMTDGSIQDMKLDQSSSVNELDEAAISCIEESWRYAPATYNGAPVEVTRKVQIIWQPRQ